MAINNLNLEIAQFAMENVTSVSGEKQAKKYKTLAKKVPVMIQKNGLINTLAFLFSKQKDSEHKWVLNHIIKWSIRNPKVRDMDGFKKDELEEGKFKEYIKVVYNLSPKEYRILTFEMINLFIWIKRFVDGIIEGDD